MEYVYAALILNESDAEINEENLTDVLEAADVSVNQSRVKALVAALEDIDIDDAVADAAAVPATGGGAPAEGDAGGAEEAPDEAEEGGEETDEEAADEADEADEGGDGGDEDDGEAGEGLGELFG